jgi:integrase
VLAKELPLPLPWRTPIMPKLTKRTVDAARPRDRDYVVWDETLPRFGLRVRRSGTKTYVVQYRTGRRTRHVTIGQHGPLTPTEARKQAMRLLAEVEAGRDPARVRDGLKSAPTVAELCARYLDDYARGRKKGRSIEQDQGMIDRLVLPGFGRVRVADVARVDLLRLHNALRETPYQANRVLALLSKMFNLAEHWGIRTEGTNPARHIDPFKEKKRERYLAAGEFTRLATALRDAEREGTESSSVVAALRLLLLTGCRLSEVTTLRWEFVDFELRLLRIPESKTGAKAIPLNAPALQLLSALPRSESPWVFPGAKAGAHVVNLSKPWSRICTRAGIENLRLHDLRHSFASVGAGLGLGLPMIGRLLGHTQASTTQRYAHLADDPLRQATEMIGQRIAGVLESTPGGEVVRLRRGH